MALFDWDQFAISQGFDDGKSMLKELYEVRGYSLRRIAEEFGIHTSTVHVQMQIYDIPRRAPYYYKRPGSLFGVNDSRLFRANPKELAAEMGCSVSSVYAERLRRQGKPLPDDEKIKSLHDVWKKEEKKIERQFTPAEIRVRLEQMFGAAEETPEFFDAQNALMDAITKEHT